MISFLSLYLKNIFCCQGSVATTSLDDGPKCEWAISSIMWDEATLRVNAFGEKPKVKSVLGMHGHVCYKSADDDAPWLEHLITRPCVIEDKPAFVFSSKKHVRT